jgi:hypothetical protein
MGGWDVWIIPIIAIAVWIIGALVRSREEDRGRKVTRPVGRPGSPQGPEAATELDRFLRELHRRRQVTEQQEARERAAAPPLTVEPVSPRPRPVPPERTGPRRPAPRTTRRPVAGPVRQTIPTVIPVTQPVPVAAPSPPSVQPVPVATVAAPVESPPPEAIPVLPPSHLKQTLDGLLQSPDRLRAAVVLQEILGPPVCCRRR